MDNSIASDVLGATGTRKSLIMPLTLDNVSYEIGGMRLIKDLGAEFSSHDLSIVLGPNGAGKSLFLRLCHGLIQPSKGVIKWGGSQKASAERHQAMVFQRPVMLRRDVFANLDHSLKHRGVNKRARIQVIEKVLSNTGLTRLTRVPARRLSVGEQQRLAIARAWCLAPEVLFLDEPTAALDPAATYSLEKIINDIRKTGTKIIMTTQDLGQAKRLANEVLFLYRGRFLERAIAKEFFERPKNDLAQAFLNGDLLWWNRKELKPPQKSDRHEEK